MMERYEIKRFLEYWSADQAFRDQYQTDPVAAVKGCHLPVDALACQVMVDETLAASLDASQVHPKVMEYRQWIKAKIARRTQHRERCATSNTKFASWRQRQMNRYFTQVKPAQFDSNVHSPLAIELNLGCSVGCPYCGANAGRLKKIARFTPDNARLFRELLHTLAAFLGPEVDRGFLYYATEPLDNPDYEKYLAEFYEEFGCTPQTTTAAWDRNLSRTRQVLAQSRANNGMINRFSVNRLEQFYFCMENFSSQELEDVELILQNPESVNLQVAAGRGRQANPDAPEGTISCVSGFRINLPEREIKLVSPANDLSRYPGGEMVFARGTFHNGPSLNSWLQDCQTRILGFEGGDDFIPRLRPDLQVTYAGEDTTILRTKSMKVKITDPLAQAVTRLIDGHRSLDAIVDSLLNAYEAANIYYTLKKWWTNGYMEDPFVMNQAETALTGQIEAAA